MCATKESGSKFRLEILEPGRQDLPQDGRSIRALIPHSGSADRIRPFAALFFLYW